MSPWLLQQSISGSPDRVPRRRQVSLRRLPRHFDGAGSFAFVKGADGGANAGTSGNTFSCPSAAGGNPLVYVVASGGNTLGTGDTTVNNSAAVFIAPYGPCKEHYPSSFVDMNEVTTVATMAALQQSFSIPPFNP